MSSAGGHTASAAASSDLEVMSPSEPQASAPATSVAHGEHSAAVAALAASLASGNASLDITARLAPLLIANVHGGVTGARLLHDSDRDGRRLDTWHAQVDGVRRTVSIVRTDGGHWFGGYTSVGFGGDDGLKRDEHAFIFTLVNPHGIPPTAYRLKPGKEDTAVFHHVVCGPSFGGGFGHDIVVGAPFAGLTGCYVNFPQSYEDTTGLGCDTFTGAFDGWRPSAIYTYALD